MEAIILAGGKGTRLAPYTSVLPKPLIPVGGMPICEIILRQLKMAGFTQVTLATGYLSNLIKTYFGDGSKIGLPIQYVHEETPLGTAGPLAALKNRKDSVLVMNGDILTTIPYQDMMREHEKTNSALTIAIQKKESTVAYGTIQREGNVVKQLVEKPTHQYEVSMGIYVMSPKALAKIPEGTFYDMPQLIKALIEEEEQVIAYPNDALWIDVGQVQDLARASEIFSEKREFILNENSSKRG